MFQAQIGYRPFTVSACGSSVLAVVVLINAWECGRGAIKYALRSSWPESKGSSFLHYEEIGSKNSRIKKSIFSLSTSVQPAELAQDQKLTLPQRLDPLPRYGHPELSRHSSKYSGVARPASVNSPPAFQYVLLICQLVLVSMALFGPLGVLKRAFP